MVNIVKNSLFLEFQELLESSSGQYLNISESFYKQQSEAINILKKRVFFEKIVDESISFNRKLNWQDDTANLHLANSAEELIEVFKLRSDVYTSLNYGKEFPDVISGLNFDKYDNHSAIIYYKAQDSHATGTVRLIFDTPSSSLPTEDKINITEIRKKDLVLGEISRIIVDQKQNGLNQEFKYLMKGIYRIFINNDIDMAVSVIKSEHLKLYKKLGGVDVIDEVSKYGELKDDFSIITYNPEQASAFFKRAFLK